jgi:hypothetical protein
MTPEQLGEGYRKAYEELYRWGTVFARRPEGGAFRTASYLAVTALYKKWDWLWRGLVPLRLTHAVWHPVIEMRRRMSLGGRIPFPSHGPAEKQDEVRSRASSRSLALVA